jgi:hypothetical protein
VAAASLAAALVRKRSGNGNAAMAVAA